MNFIIRWIVVLALVLSLINVSLKPILQVLSLPITVLTLGIFIAGIIGLVTGDLTIASWAQAIYDGFCGMNEVFFLTLLCGGMSELIAKNGGIQWLIEKFQGIMKDNKSAQIGIAGLVSACDIATANNTVAIIVAGGSANDISKEYKVDPRRTASLLDVFACVLQGIIPYGAQLLVAASLTNATVEGAAMSSANIIPSLWYCWFLAIFGIISIFVPFADGITRKDPWNWEYDCSESKVAEKKAQLAAASESHMN